MNSFFSENKTKILDSLPLGVFVIDKEFKIQYVNSAASEITHKNPAGLIGEICTSFCKSDRCELGCPITEVLRTGKNVIDLKSTIEDSNGDRINIIVNASVLKDNKNTPVGGIISFKKSNENYEAKISNSYEDFHGIIGKSKSMLEIFDLIREISSSFAPVLITGETGVGKELVANAIQKTSGRAKFPFVKVNCAVLPDNLLASELFGHVKGAYTDAKQERLGRFEYADGGTVFLDEISEIPFNMQAQLLRVLQDGTFERLGETRTRKTDIRIIAATNKNLKDEISNKRFREDLYYRLNVIPINVPPLRERKDDLTRLVCYFLEKYSKKCNKNIDVVDDETMDIFTNYDWPGNIRELENCIEYAFIRSKRSDFICSCSLPAHLRINKNCGQKLSSINMIDDEKVSTLLALLRQNNWNQTKVAEILGINRSTIYRRLKKYNSN